MGIEERITGKVVQMDITSQSTQVILAYSGETVKVVSIPMKLDSGLYGQEITYTIKKPDKHGGTEYRVECHDGKVVFNTFISGCPETD